MGQSEASMPPGAKGKFDMEMLIGSLLLIGLVISLALILSGTVMSWLEKGNFELSGVVQSKNLFYFTSETLQALGEGDFQPRRFIDLGLAVLIVTPYLRGVASLLFFALVDHNLKYSLFTAFVLAVLTFCLVQTG